MPQACHLVKVDLVYGSLLRLFHRFLFACIYVSFCMYILLFYTSWHASGTSSSESRSRLQVSFTGLFLHTYTSLFAFTYVSFISGHASDTSSRESRSRLQVSFLSAYIHVSLFFPHLQTSLFWYLEMPQVRCIVKVDLVYRSLFASVYVFLCMYIHPLYILTCLRHVI